MRRAFPLACFVGCCCTQDIASLHSQCLVRPSRLPSPCQEHACSTTSPGGTALGQPSRTAELQAPCRASAAGRMAPARESVTCQMASLAHSTPHICSSKILVAQLQALDVAPPSRSPGNRGRVRLTTRLVVCTKYEVVHMYRQDCAPKRPKSVFPHHHMVSCNGSRGIM